MRFELKTLGPVLLVLLAGYLATTFYDSGSFSGFSSVSGAAVVAKDQCPADKTLFKISDTKNAHAELATQSNYNFAACWDGQGSTDRMCYDGKNTVIRLSADTNAHVEGPSQKTYQKQACFGTLNCKLGEKNRCSDLGPTYKCVVSLSGYTNAHVAECGFYENDLCCSDGSPGGGGQPKNDKDGDGIWDDGDLQGIGNNYCNPASNDPKRKDLQICDDNCINKTNADQLDTDNDGAGDDCDDFKQDSCSIQKKNDNCPFKQDCKEVSAKWDVSSVVEGNPASLTVTGSTECSERTVFFKVFDSVNKQLVTMEPQPATFGKSTTTATAASQWTGEYYSSGSNKYYFQAVVTGGKAEIRILSPSDKLLTVTKAPSAVCGNGKVEGSNNEECDDGNTNDADDCSNSCKRKRYAGGRSCQDDPLCKGVPATYMVCKSDVTQSYFCITGSGGCKQLSTPSLPCGKDNGVQKVCVRGADSCKSPTCNFQYTKSSCVNGQQTITCTATGGNHCVCGSDYPKTVSCVQAHEEEPFPVFSGFNFIVTILLLITFYTFRRGVRWKLN